MGEPLFLYDFLKLGDSFEVFYLSNFRSAHENAHQIFGGICSTSFCGVENQKL